MTTTIRPRPRGDALDADLQRFFGMDPAVLADPFPLYARLRERGTYRFGERVLVPGYTAAREVLTASTTRQGLAVKSSRFRAAFGELSTEDQQRITEIFSFYEKRPSGVDGARHNRLRKLAIRAFTPRVIAGMEDRIQAVIAELLDELGARREIEFVEEFAYRLPLIVICEMLDIPTDRRDDLRRWSADLGTFVGSTWSDPDNVRTTHSSVFALREHLREVFGSRREQETTPLLRALLDAQGDDPGDGEPFTEDELVAMITQFVFAGHETTTNLLANSVVALLRDRRDQWELLRAQPDAMPVAVDELLRFAGPTQYIDKIAADDCVIGGVEVRQWDTVSVMLASANRDAEAYTDPEVLDLTRREKPHLGFGLGAHHCLGASLARMEVALVLRILTTRYPGARLATDAVEYHRNHMLRGPQRLDMVLAP